MAHGDSPTSTISIVSLSLSQKSVEQESFIVRRMRRKVKGEEEIVSNRRDRESLRVLQLKLHRRQKLLALLAAVSIVLAIGVNEECASGDYKDYYLNASMIAKIRARGTRICSKNDIKILQTIITVAILVVLYDRYRTKAKLSDLQVLLEERRYNFIQVMPPTLQTYTSPAFLGFVLEFFINCFHTFPFLYADVEMVVMKRHILYRLESIMGAVMFVRIYHVLRWLFERTYLKYFDLENSHLLKDDSTIQLVMENLDSRRSLAFKIAMAASPAIILLFCVTLLHGSTSYLVRIAEGPAGLPHSKYYWDQIWLIITQASTGEGKMFPQTHAGRFATVVSIFGMPLIMALVTANVTRRMNLSGEEMRLMLSIEHNKYKMKVFSCAAKMIQRWWRSREGVGADVAMQTMLLVGEFYKAGNVLYRFRRSHMSMVSERNVGLSRWLGLPVEKKKSKEEEKKEKKEKLRARRSSEATEFPSSYYSIDDVVNEIRRVSSRFQRLSVKCEDTKMRRSVSPASSLSDSRLLMPTMNG